jgi:hypothetical protein
LYDVPTHVVEPETSVTLHNHRSILWLLQDRLPSQYYIFRTPTLKPMVWLSSLYTRSIIPSSPLGFGSMAHYVRAHGYACLNIVLPTENSSPQASMDSSYCVGRSFEGRFQTEQSTSQNVVRRCSSSHEAIPQKGLHDDPDKHLGRRTVSKHDLTLKLSQHTAANKTSDSLTTQRGTEYPDALPGHPYHPIQRFNGPSPGVTNRPFLRALPPQPEAPGANASGALTEVARFISLTTKVVAENVNMSVHPSP